MTLIPYKIWHIGLTQSQKLTREGRIVQVQTTNQCGTHSTTNVNLSEHISSCNKIIIQNSRFYRAFLRDISVFTNSTLAISLILKPRILFLNYFLLFYVRQAQQLRSCQQYLRQRSQSSEEEEADQSRGDIQRCCQQLQQIQDPQCRCEGLRQVVQQEQQRGELQGRERQQMLQTAQNLPGLCRVSPQRCEIQTRSWF